MMWMLGLISPVFKQVYLCWPVTEVRTAIQFMESSLVERILVVFRDQSDGWIGKTNVLLDGLGWELDTDSHTVWWYCELGIIQNWAFSAKNITLKVSNILHNSLAVKFSQRMFKLWQSWALVHIIHLCITSFVFQLFLFYKVSILMTIV